jgi:hypothetical protein
MQCFVEGHFALAGWHWAAWLSQMGWGWHWPLLYRGQGHCWASNHGVGQPLQQIIMPRTVPRLRHLAFNIFIAHKYPPTIQVLHVWKHYIKDIFLARCRWWLTPVILATQEADIRRTTVQSQPQANSSWDPVLKIPITNKGWWSGSSGKSAYLASVRPWAQTPILQKKKKISFTLDLESGSKDHELN